MSTSLMRAECRKFVPNIFNKAKCSNCFRQKEEHSAEALESNRAARKVSKCGYLFVAPGWDFSNPLNRTKRWQRRWFVLYDDGELSYSLDEHPETVPQASIDMNKVLEVSDAEEVTGNSFSLAITAPETVHFVKGTCREEAKWWKDVLIVFPRNKGRHKRNATFSGSQTSAILQQSALTCRASVDTRSRFNNCHVDSAVLIRPPSASPQWLHVEEEIYPTRDIKVPPDVLDDSPSNSIDSLQNYSAEMAKADLQKIYREHQPISSTSPPTRDKIHSEGKTRTRRALNREKRGLKGGRSFTEELSIDGKNEEDFPGDITSIKNTRNLSDELTTILRETKTEPSEVATRILLESEKSKRKEKLKDIADSLTRPRARRQVITSSERRSSSQVKPTRDGECSEEEKTGYATPSPVAREGEDVDGTTDKPIRGDPDGCGLDLTSQRYSPSSELRVDLPAEDLLNIKKGWLMKQDSNQEWTKHWFVLRGTALMYYRDPNAEDKGIFDGVMDLSSVNSVTELQVQRNYGFQTITWDDRRYVLSAVTAGIRSNWMTAIRRAAGIPEPMDISLTLGKQLERELDRSNSESNSSQYFESKNSSSHNYLDSCLKRTPGSKYFGAVRASNSQFEKSRSSNNSSSLPISPGSQYVENLLQKSSSAQFPNGGGVKRSSSAQSVVGERHYQFSSDDDFRRSPEVRGKEKGEWKEAPAPLPPSPPLNRTPISRVKERAKTQTSRSRVYNKRSKSSPPMLRKNNFDGVCSDDVICSEKRDESVKRPVMLDMDRHLKEIEELKSQLNFAIGERSNAEKELVRLRQRKSETNFQVEELLRTLKLTEDELKVKNQELEDLDGLKQRYNKLAKEHEIVLTSWRENAVGDDWRDMYQQLKSEYAGEKETWEMKFENVNSVLRETTERCEVLGRELARSEETVEALKLEVTNLSERLIRDMEENEGLYGRMRDLEGRCLSSSRGRGRSVDSLSDLTNIDLDADLVAMDKERLIEEYEELRSRFEKSIQEIRAMKRELRESHACYDDLELTVINLRQDAKRREEQDKAQSALMASRIEDLTLKLSASEKQSRNLKQKISRSESREKRRSLSLKGESFQIGREMEEKLAEMEAKVNALEIGKPAASVIINTTPTEKSARLRRKSLDSATSSEPMKLLIRLSSLENKIAKADEKLRNAQGDGNKKPEVTVNSEESCETFSRAFEKIQECRSLLVSVKSGKRPPSPLHGKTFVNLENKLLEIENILSGYEEFSLPSETLKVKKSVECMVTKLESLLKSKLTELLNRRNELKDAGALDEDAKLKLLAEKLAYESILIRKIIEAVETFSADNHHCKHIVMNSEMQETNRLINAVRDRINGKEVEIHRNSLDHLTKVLTEALVTEGALMGDGKKMKSLLTDPPEPEISFDKLLENQSSLNQMVGAYKRDMLREIASLLASETVCLTAEYEEGRANSSEDKRIREAWALAQEALNKELVQAEISHVTMRCASIYEAGASRELEGNLTLIAEEYKRHEEFAEQMNECLRCVMDVTIEELTSEYEKCLSESKDKKPIKLSTSELEENSKVCRAKLEEFVTVVAQKALVDERIHLLAKTTRCERPGFDSRPIVRAVCMKSDQSEPNLETRFIYLYQKFSLECMQSVEQLVSSRQDLSEIVCGLNRCAIMIKRLKKSFGMEESKEKCETEMNLGSVRDTCCSLSDELEDVVKCLQGDRPCTKCDALEESLHKLQTEFDEEIRILRHCHEQQMKDLRGELESQRDSLVCQHEQEQAQLMERARKLERRLGTLDAEYSQQMDNLRTAYHRTLSAELDQGGSTEDSIRHRYQTEIEQLRALCEKGLVAVDNSHRRIIAELEEKHRQELAAAAAEKEQALAEETQATLAALDAMRKAHETEVQKEINKFKAEFLKKMQSNHDISALHREHKAEMDEIKKEILSLSEKYSVKCVESASLEEQLNVVNKQLTQAQQHIMQLDARNKQLRAHLVSEAKSDLDDFGSLKCQKIGSVDDEDKYLSEAEMSLKKMKSAGRPNRTSSRRLKYRRKIKALPVALGGLTISSVSEAGITDSPTLLRHGSSRQTHSLDEYSLPKTAESDPPTREPLSLDRYLKNQSWKVVSGKTVARLGENSSIKERVTRWQEPTNLIRAEFLRSPKCSLFTTSNFSSPSLNQLSGMVAERKKLFEH